MTDPIREVTVGLTGLDAFVSELAGLLEAGMWLFLEGDLGAGKTTFVQHLAQMLGAKGEVTSPTFAIVNRVSLPEQRHPSVRSLVHVDLYRLKQPEEICFLGLENELDASSLGLFEWPDMLEPEDWEIFFATTKCRRPNKVLHIYIHYNEEYGNDRSYSVAPAVDIPCLR